MLAHRSRPIFHSLIYFDRAAAWVLDDELGLSCPTDDIELGVMPCAVLMIKSTGEML